MLGDSGLTSQCRRYYSCLIKVEIKKRDVNQITQGHIEQPNTRLNGLDVFIRCSHGTFALSYVQLSQVRDLKRLRAQGLDRAIFSQKDLSDKVKITVIIPEARDRVHSIFRRSKQNYCTHDRVEIYFREIGN